MLNGNVWPHGHGKGEGARERTELLQSVLNICCIYVAF